MSVTLVASSIHRLAVFTLETDYLHVQNPSKLTDKQTEKIRLIIRPKLEPFRFHIKTDYLSDTNYSTDNPSETDDLVSSVRTAIGLDGCLLY